MINNTIWKFTVSFYNVITLNICYSLTKFVSYTKEINNVNDLRKYLVYEELKQFCGENVSEEKFKE